MVRGHLIEISILERVEVEDSGVAKNGLMQSRNILHARLLVSASTTRDIFRGIHYKTLVNGEKNPEKISLMFL